VTDPTRKSAAPKSRMTSRANCSRITHLTPAALTTVKATMTSAATALSASGEWSGQRRPAMDSPNPVAHRALPMA